MRNLLRLFFACAVLCGCAQQTGQTGNAKALTVAKQTIAKREQWAYDGDYKVTDYIVEGKRAGWVVTVMRINDPHAPEGNRTRYLGTTPVTITIDQSGNVVSYRSPFHPQ